MNKSKFSKLQRESYTRLASNFDCFQRRENRNHLNKIKAISSFLNVNEGDNVLEIGVGTGIHANYFLKLNNFNFNFIGIDLSYDMLIESKKKLMGFDNVTLKQMDGENLHFKNETFDKVYISGSLHHFFDLSLGIFEMIRVLKKGGKFCIMEPNYIFPTNFYVSHNKIEEKNMRWIVKKNFIESFRKCKINNYSIYNFAYTPPYPKFFIPMYDRIDKILSKIPVINKFSIMIFICGEK